MKIILIQPDFQKIKSVIIIPNIGLLYLARALKLKGHEVMVFDAMKERWTETELAEHLSQNNPDIIGYSIFTQSLSYVKQVARILKNRNKSIIQIAGGVHPSCAPAETLEMIPELDYLFQGESEKSLPLFIDNINEKSGNTRWDDIPGLVYRKDNGSIRTNSPKYLNESDFIDIPEWDLADLNTYPLAPNGIFSRHDKIAPIITGRGCPYKCSFCASHKILGPKVRKRQINHIINEISFLYHKYSIKEFHIMDDFFNYNKKFVLDFAKQVRVLDLPICFACPSGIRLSTLDREMLIAMENAGIYSMAVGIESGSQRILNKMNKKLTIEEIREKIHLVNNYSDIKMTGFFIIGYPTETEEELLKTINFACELPVHRANFFNFTPFPGSEIYNNLKEEGKLETIDEDRLYIHHIEYHPDTISRKKLASLQRKAHFSFYFRWKIIKGIRGEIKTLSQLRILFARIKIILFQ